MALLFGQLIGSMVVAFVSACVYLIAGFVAGMDFKAGALGVPTEVVLGVLIALGFAGLGAYIGLRAGTGEAVQGFFPLLFVLLFLSSVNLPRNLIEQDWFRTIATYNPVSYLFEGLRSLVLFGWDGEALALGFGIAAVIAVVALIGAQRALRTRLLRT
jgi:ABC-2 type transport system permease protein